MMKSAKTSLVVESVDKAILQIKSIMAIPELNPSQLQVMHSLIEYLGSTTTKDSDLCM